MSGYDTKVPQIADADSGDIATSGILTRRMSKNLGRCQPPPGSVVSTTRIRNIAGTLRTKGKKSYQPTVEDVAGMIGEVINVANVTTQDIRSEVHGTQAAVTELATVSAI